jgi:hypothetical protein
MNQPPPNNCIERDANSAALHSHPSCLLVGRLMIEQYELDNAATEKIKTEEV